MDTRSIAIFHYHLQPGGVTTVISLSVRAIVASLSEVERIDVVTGRRDGAGEFMEALRGKVEAIGTDGTDGTDGPEINLDVRPAIDYADSSRMETSQSIADELLEHHGGSVWWIHNYHLGKNPAFTDALLLIAREHPEQRMILHIHDFPECARYQNLEFLNEHTSGRVYPVGANIRYAVINARDRKLLIDAGIPEHATFLLSNPVDSAAIDRSGSVETKRHIARSFGVNAPRYEQDAPIVLSPVRTIRRKNILESALFCASWDHPVNLIVTLPGVSEREKPYSDIVASGYAKGLIPGLFGIGERLDDSNVGFLDLVGAADLITSASVQEGFGFFYIEALLWGLPLFARRIDILDGMSDVLDRESVCLYESFRVPLDQTEREELRKRYESRIARLSQLMEQHIADQLSDAASELTSRTLVDYSYLDVESQYRILKTTAESAKLRGEIRAANEGLYREFDRLLRTSRDTEAAERDERFTFEGFVDTVREITSSFGRKTEEPNGDVQANLISAFARLEYFRILYE